MDYVFMDARTFCYYLWAWPMVFACSAFYTLIVMLGLKELTTLEDAYFNAVGLFTYGIFCFFGLRYYAPMMRKIEFDETLDGKYTSVRASIIGIVTCASIGTILSIPQIDKIQFLSDLPRWLAVGSLFIAFAAAVFVFSHYVWKPGRRR